MLKILFVDDEPESVADASLLLEAQESEFVPRTENFEDGMDSLESARPDVVVLDIWKGEPQTSEPKGADVLEEVWEKQFCPVIIYSADPRIISEDPQFEHPFVKVVQKGSGSDQRVLNAVLAFQPHVKALKEGEETIRNAFTRAMWDVAPDAFSNFEDENRRIDIIVRAGRRRVAALMDEPLPEEPNIASWEQYLSPPISLNPQLGDILRVGSASSDDPTSFRVILTPSCDLVPYGKKGPKAAQVLVANCSSMERGLERIGLSSPFRDFYLRTRYSQPRISQRNHSISQIARKGPLHGR